jgi:predicted dithiol-disulfide oxidoreductase (DUF899 family)
MSPGLLKAESAEYKKSRDDLPDAEIALRDQCERFAALRRGLPQAATR